MGILDRISALITGFGHPTVREVRMARGAAVLRWRKAFRDQPELAEDLIRLSGLLAVQPHILTEGIPTGIAPVDPHAVMFERGQQQLAKVLLSLGGITPYELTQLMEKPDEA
ncbi:hypothetical protein [Seohaeicola zhoushanensis]|uniref:Uncharacterized protein n=1 Tax=Seohaeicola zhoushanensis TaxID=1569283 RepID=A0A8J3GT87_9RHOB|nr:hypothetical protein [Seohaeicola zhoushanensis]GHF33259.1 hypothetical protein GCM10017056_00840 [Seohaeicola zhoushanensis]